MWAYLYSISRRRCNLNIAKHQKTTKFPSKIWKALIVHRIFVAFFQRMHNLGDKTLHLSIICSIFAFGNLKPILLTNKILIIHL